MIAVKIVKIVKDVNIAVVAVIYRMPNTVMIMFNTHKKNIWIKLEKRRKLCRSRMNDLLVLLFFFLINFNVAVCRVIKY